MNDIIKMIDEHVDQEGLIKDIAVKFLLPKLEKLVADTSNPYDDSALAALKKALGL